MTVIRAQVAFGADLPEVRHRLVMTPHFNHSLNLIEGAPDWQTLADDLATAMNTYSGTTREINVKLYDAEDPPPSYPRAQKTLNPGTYPVSSVPRELALCLSYRAGDGPRRRGRLYVPCVLVSTTVSAVRPTTPQQQKVVDLAAPLRNLGGTNVDWCVWSRRDRSAHSVIEAWCDNEWDVMRSRGMAPTGRLMAPSAPE